MKSFVQSVVEAFDISSKTVRVGVIAFSDYAEVQFDLRRYNNKEDVKRAVGIIPYYGQGKNTSAIRLILYLLFNRTQDTTQNEERDRYTQ